MSLVKTGAGRSYFSYGCKWHYFYVYPETVWHFEDKECHAKICATSGTALFASLVPSKHSLVSGYLITCGMAVYEWCQFYFNCNRFGPWNSAWKVSSHSVSHEIRRILYNTEVHYRLRKSHSFVRLLSQMNTSHAVTFISLTIFFDIRRDSCCIQGIVAVSNIYTLGYNWLSE